MASNYDLALHRCASAPWVLIHATCQIHTSSKQDIWEMGNVLGFNRAQQGALYLQVDNLDVTRRVFERLDWGFMYYYDQRWMGLNLLRISKSRMCGNYRLLILCQWMWFQINCFFSLLSNIVAHLVGRQFSLAFQRENTAFHFYTQPLFSNLSHF